MIMGVLPCPEHSDSARPSCEVCHPPKSSKTPHKLSIFYGQKSMKTEQNPLNFDFTTPPTLKLKILVESLPERS